MKDKKVAIVHYWLVGMRGGEKVIEALLDIFPEADIFTHVVDKEKISKNISDRVIATTFISKLPQAKKRYQSYLPFMPMALEQLDLRDYDIVISSESGPSKGLITNPNCLHICYCHSPMRYVWDMYHDYTENAGWLKRSIMAYLLHKIRLWDLASSFRVDYFVANSSFVSKRIQKFYRRDSEVIHPPTIVSNFEINSQLGDFYLMLGQLVAYKNTELAVRAFNKNGKKLIVIGSGEELDSLRKIANENVTFLGFQDDKVVKEHLSTCKALVFPGVEDFGMVPIETMASGRPVIALKKGGALDYIVEGETGIFFEDANEESLNMAIDKFEETYEAFDSQNIRTYAEKFDISKFKESISNFIEERI